MKSAPYINNQLSPNESEMITALRCGLPWAYETMIKLFEQKMLAVARRFFRCEQDAADAVQDAFIAAFQSIGSFSQTSRLSTWLHRIVVNACLMKLRSTNRRREIHAQDDLAVFERDERRVRDRFESEPLSRLHADELKAYVHQCINGLPESYREILMLRDINEHDTAETARLLGESSANIKTRLHRARHALRANMCLRL